MIIWEIGMIILEIRMKSRNLHGNLGNLNDICEIGIGKWDGSLRNWDNQEFDFPPLHPNA